MKTVGYDNIVDIYRYLWFYMLDICWYVWLLLDIYGYLWFYTWISMVGFTSIDIYSYSGPLRAARKNGPVALNSNWRISFHSMSRQPRFARQSLPSDIASRYRRSSGFCADARQPAGGCTTTCCCWDANHHASRRGRRGNYSIGVFDCGTGKPGKVKEKCTNKFIALLRRKDFVPDEIRTDRIQQIEKLVAKADGGSTLVFDLWREGDGKQELKLYS